MGSKAYSQNKMIKDVDIVQSRTCLKNCSDFFWLNNLLTSYHTQRVLLFQISSKRCFFTSSGTTSMRSPSEPEPLSHLPSLPLSFIYMINPPGGQQDKPAAHCMVNHIHICATPAAHSHTQCPKSRCSQFTLKPTVACGGAVKIV